MVFNKLQLCSSKIFSPHNYLDLMYSLQLTVFQSKPEIPPSVAQMKQEQVKHDKILPTLWKIMKNPAVLLFFVSYGMNCAPSTSVAIFLNEIIFENFPVSKAFRYIYIFSLIYFYLIKV